MASTSGKHFFNVFISANLYSGCKGSANRRQCKINYDLFSMLRCSLLSRRSLRVTIKWAKCQILEQRKQRSACISFVVKWHNWPKVYFFVIFFQWRISPFAWRIAKGHLLPFKTSPFRPQNLSFYFFIFLLSKHYTTTPKSSAMPINKGIFFGVVLVKDYTKDYTKPPL